MGDGYTSYGVLSWTAKPHLDALDLDSLTQQIDETVANLADTDESGELMPGARVFAGGTDDW